MRRAALIAGFALALVALVSACGGSGAGPSSAADGSATASAASAAAAGGSATASPAGGSASASPTTGPTQPAVAGLPDFTHVWVLVLENTGYERIVGAAEAPYLNELIARYGLAEAYHGVGRPSQPNYLALFSGSTHGVTDNGPHDIDAPTLADQLEASGRTWRAHAENLPSGCFLGETASGGRDGDGGYARKHMPAMSFTAITSDPARCANVQDFTAFEPGASDYVLLSPNLCHAMHDCSVAEGDAWLSSFLPRILESEAFTSGGVLFLTFDEDHTDDPGGGRVATIVISPDVASGTRSAVRADHYSLLRTIQDAWGLDCLAESCAASAMTEFFTGP